MFEYLQQREPSQFSDGQVRTLQRRMKNWRALEGPPREVFFAQDHDPGELCQSDFTHCRELGITINGQAFPHLVYHFVLSYSNRGPVRSVIRKRSKASVRACKMRSGS